MTPLDCRGVPVSTRRVDSLEQYERALEAMLSGRGDPVRILDAALKADPEFIMGYAFRAALLLVAPTRHRQAELEACVASLTRRAMAANERERLYTAAARATLERDPVRAYRLYGDIAIEFPHDLLALRIAHTGDFRLGQRTMLRDRMAQVLPYWNDTVPGYSYVLGMRAFGLVESGLYPQAEQAGRAALALDARNPGAIHAVTHVLEMQGRQNEGITWLRSTIPDWADAGGYAIHQAWHLALFHLEVDEPAAALRIYDEYVRAGFPGQCTALVDASAMLWRMYLQGVDTGDRWSELADSWGANELNGAQVFNEVHAMLAFVADGREREARELRHRLRSAAALAGAARRRSLEAALSVCEALLSFGREDYDDAVERLLSVRDLPYYGGGSQAQYDVIHLTMVEAALRSGRARLARALAAERCGLRPDSPLNRRLAERAAMQMEGPAPVRRDAARVARPA